MNNGMLNLKIGLVGIESFKFTTTNIYIALNNSNKILLIDKTERTFANSNSRNQSCSHRIS